MAHLYEMWMDADDGQGSTRHTFNATPKTFKARASIASGGHRTALVLVYLHSRGADGRPYPVAYFINGREVSEAEYDEADART